MVAFFLSGDHSHSGRRLAYASKLWTMHADTVAHLNDRTPQQRRTHNPPNFTTLQQTGRTFSVATSFTIVIAHEHHQYLHAPLHSHVHTSVPARIEYHRGPQRVTCLQKWFCATLNGKKQHTPIMFQERQSRQHPLSSTHSQFARTEPRHTCKCSCRALTDETIIEKLLAPHDAINHFLTGTSNDRKPRPLHYLPIFMCTPPRAHLEYYLYRAQHRVTSARVLAKRTIISHTIHAVRGHLGANFFIDTLETFLVERTSALEKEITMSVKYVI